jgi:hypothetical protein
MRVYRRVVVVVVVFQEESLVSRSGFLTFFHDYMRQAVEARYLRPQNRYNQYRMRIVSYFNR